MGFETLRIVLQEVEQKVPFCNFRSFFDLTDRPFPSSLGGDCYVQAEAVDSRLGPDFKVEYIQEIEGAHVIPYVKHRPSQGRFIVDPMMLIGEPVPLVPVLRRDSEPLSFHVGSPDRSGNTRARVEYVNRGRNRFAATLYNNRFDKSDYVEYLYDSRVRFKTVPRWTPEIFFGQGKLDKFVLKFALPDRGVVAFRFEVSERVLHCTHDTAGGGYRRFSDQMGEEAMERFSNPRLEPLDIDYRRFRKLLLETIQIQDRFMHAAKKPGSVLRS